MCLKSGHGQCLRCYQNNPISKTANLTLQLCDLDVHEEVAASCEDCGLADFGRTGEKGLKKWL